MLVWYAVRTVFKADSEPVDSPELDSAERLKLSAEAEESANGTPIKEVVKNKPGSSAGVWMGWFWGLVAVGWFSLLGWLFSH